MQTWKDIICAIRLSIFVLVSLVYAKERNIGKMADLYFVQRERALSQCLRFS